MNTSHSLARAETYLNTEWRESGAPWSLKKTTPFVTVSRQSGSGGTSLARMLARHLNGRSPEGVFWQVSEGNLTEKMLKANHLPARIGRFLPEDHVSELNASVGEFVGLHPSLWELIQKTNETIVALADAGNAIIVGRGANFATSHLSNGLHVRLIAPADFRAHSLGKLYNLSERQASLYNTKRDAERRLYVKHTFNADIENPANYDLLINTSKVPLRAATEIIVAHLTAMAKGRGPS